MDKYEHRRSALQALVASIGHGGIASVAAKIGKTPSYVSRMLYAPGKAGRKRIGEDTLDVLAAAYPNAFVNTTTPAPHAAGDGDAAISSPSWLTSSPQHAHLARSIDRATSTGSLSPDTAKHLAGLIDSLPTKTSNPSRPSIADAIRRNTAHGDDPAT